MRKVVFLLLCLATTCGCTEQRMARQFGGSYKVILPKGQRLIEATWKGADLWYLTEDMDSAYMPKTKTFQEDSQWGVFEGSITFIENK